jgi:flavin reductase (DIM6/NTAB) family NADH-FMN oxidoreductase RutF
MIIADVLCVTVDDKYMDEKGRFSFAKAKPIVYSHGEYYRLGEKLGTFGYSVKKKGKKKGKKPSKKH